MQGNEPCHISDAEITPTPASKILDMTKAIPCDTNVSPPRCYDQCIPVGDVYGGQQDAEQVPSGDDELIENE